MNTDVINDILNLLTGLDVNTSCAPIVELVIEDFDYWVNQPDAYVGPTECISFLAQPRLVS